MFVIERKRLASAESEFCAVVSFCVVSEFLSGE